MEFSDHKNDSDETAQKQASFYVRQGKKSFMRRNGNEEETRGEPDRDETGRPLT